VEATLTDEFPVMVSNDTPDGGKGGQKTEVPRRVAAKLIVEGQARPASADEAKAFRAAVAEAKRAADAAAQASKVQFTVVSTADLERIKPGRNTKE
jgi:hypothetical protein